jgi:hypothetical protein
MQNTRINGYGSDYEFSVKIKEKRVDEHFFNGEYFIEGRKGSEYELYFQNKTNKRVVVVMSVDGLSVMDGKTASDKSDGYVVEAYREITVPGWKINSNKAAKFQFRPQNDKSNTTYVELLQEEGFEVDVANQGVIGCLVFEEVEKEEKVKHIHHYHSYPYLYPYYVPRYPQWNYDNLNYYDANAPLSGMGYNAASAIGQISASSASASSLRGVTGGTVEQMNTLSAKSTNQTPIFNGFSEVLEETSLGTGFGKDTKFETTSIKFDKKDDPVWIAVINYDTIQGLRKRGIFINKTSNSKAFPGLKEKGCYVPVRR